MTTYLTKKHQDANKIYPFNYLNGLNIGHIVNGLTRPVYERFQRTSTLTNLFNKLVIKVDHL